MSGALGLSKAYVRVLSGSMAMAGTVSKFITKTTSGTMSVAGVVLKRTARGLGAILTLSATLTFTSLFGKVLGGFLQAAGSLTQTPLLSNPGEQLYNALTFIRRYMGRR